MKNVVSLTDAQLQTRRADTPVEATPLAMTLDEEHAMLDATAKVIRHELNGLPDDPALEREVEVVRVSGKIFLTFIEGRVSKLAWEKTKRGETSGTAEGE